MMIDRELYPVEGVRCCRCGGRLCKSKTPGYAYQCYECDEDFYSFEAVAEEEIQSEEEEYRDNIPENLQGGERCV